MQIKISKKEAKERVKKLRESINYYRDLYHTKDILEISEEALDSLKDELKKIEEKYPELLTADSPTQRVAGKVLDKFEKIKHVIPQWSFDDAFDFEDLEAFDKKVKNFLKKKNIENFSEEENLKNAQKENAQKYFGGGIGVERDFLSRSEKNHASAKNKNLEYFCELKIDGLKVVLEYQKGILVSAATRGDGKIGENITQNVKTIDSIPLKLKKEISGFFEGEIFISKENFDRVNKEREKEKLDLYVNPRNLAAGTIRQLDPKIVAFRKLDAFIYDIAKIDNEEKFKTQKEEMELLEELGFKVNKNNFLAKDLKEIWEFYKKQIQKKEKYQYWIDGIVLKVNNIKLQEILGYTGKAPRFAIALKFPAEEKTTIIRDIHLQVGRVGTITPVAIFDKVFLAGTTVTRASLHNEDEIKRLDVRIRDTVVVNKAGDIIPKVVRVLKELRPKESKKFVFPKKVFGCGGDGSIEKVEGKVAYRCVEKNSPELLEKKLSYFVSKNCFDISGLSGAILKVFIEKDLVGEPADIFELEEGDIKFLEGFGKKSARNIISEVNKKREISLDRFITSLSVDGLGRETAILLATEFETFEKFSKASFEDFDKIKGIGEKTSLEIINFLKDEKNKKMIKNLLKEVKIKSLKNIKNIFKESYFTNKKVLITGTFEKFSRDNLKEILRKKGAKIVSSISKNTDILLAGEKAGSKLEKAQKLEIEIFNEEKLLKKL